MGGGLVLAAIGCAVLADLARTGPAGLVVGSTLFSVGLAPVVALGTDLIVGAAPPEAAGAAAAISETSSELGGALGIAVLGSLATAIYRHDMAQTALAGVPAQAVNAAQDTLGAAAAVASRLPAASGEQLLAAARAAFGQALHVTVAACAVVSLLTAALVLLVLRRVRGSGMVAKTPSPPSTDPTSERAVPLRVAQPSDAARLLPMMADFNAGEGISLDERALRPALDRLLRDPSLGRVWFIVDRKCRPDEIVGYAVLTFGYDLEFAGHDGFLTEIYVAPRARGAGRGRSALAAIESAAGALGIRAVHLMVRLENTTARGLYESAGYQSPPRLFLSKRLAGGDNGASGRSRRYVRQAGRV
jgi:ribosomal protein S18 acetylase RimI-like enzyme